MEIKFFVFKTVKTVTIIYISFISTGINPGVNGIKSFIINCFNSS